MRLGSAEEVTVGDMKMYVVVSWGDLKRFARESDGFDEEEDATDLLEYVEDNLLDIVQRVENLEDSQGNEVSVLTSEVLDEFPPNYVMQAWSQILGMGEQAGPPVRPDQPAQPGRPIAR